MKHVLIFAAAFLFNSTTIDASEEPARIKILFLGDNGPHRPARRFSQLQPVLERRGIDLTYTDNVEHLNPKTLNNYAGLMIYANTTRISAEQEQALLDFVRGGRGFIPIHCASYCFIRSSKYVDLVGAQFRRHGTGVFRTTIAEPEHPVMRGFKGFESWDETYVHTKHNELDRTVLTYRVDDEGKESWTWVREEGKGRVFYTAWGHDGRTWGNPGFHNLIERGIRWAVGADPSVVPDFPDPSNGAGGTSVSSAFDAPFRVPEMTALRTDVIPFEYVDVGKKIPNYPPSQRWGTQEEPLSKMQVPLPAEESIKHFVVPRGFHVELFVSEPQLGGKPICMAWDERGRLWVAETYDYPNQLQPPGKGRDRIRICEDTDGDWKADKFTVFAERLSIPTSIAFHRGGVIVQDGTRTLYMKDTNGDDVADETTVMFTGWNQRDTHGGVSNFQYGLDNWIWAMQGYNPSRPTRPGDEPEDDSRFAAGFFRFRPDGSNVEFIRSTSNNTWGLGISEEGIIFGSTANRVPSVYMPIPNRYYERVKGWAPSLVLGSIADNHLFRPITDRVRQVDHHGGYTAGAGHALYTARNYPRKYWNRVAFVCGPTGHLVGGFVLQRDGADFHSSNTFNLLASDDEWSAPIMAEVGPDGNVWVIDWYNFIVQHNPTPLGFETGRGNAYETDLRDKKHGRIYRIVHDQAEEAKTFSLAGATNRQLVETLKNETMFWRKQAQRLLVERGASDMLPALFELVENTEVDDIGLNTASIHALWTIHGLGALDGSNARAGEVVTGALKHPSAGVRRNAIHTLPSTESSVEALLEAKMLSDSDPQVRLAATLALADLPAIEDAGAIVAQFAVEATTRGDRWLGDAAVAAAANNSQSFLQSIASHDAVPDDLTESIQIVAEHYARSAPTASVPSLIAKLLDANPSNIDPIVRGLAAGWPADTKPTGDAELEANLEKLVNKLEGSGRGHVLRLASIWGMERLAKYSDQIVSDLLRELDDEAASVESRVTAAIRLVDFQPASEAAVLEILNRITPRTPPLLAASLVETLRGSEAPELGTILAERILDLTPSVRKAAILVLLSRRTATRALLDAMDEGRVQLAELSLDQRQGLSRHPDRRVRRRAQRILARGGALPNPDRQKVLDQLLSVTRVSGNATAGKVVFNKVCAKCHQYRGEGVDVGPNLTGMSAHPKDELLTHIIDPNRSVEGNFRVYNVATTDGRIFNGMLAAESRTAVELFDAEGKKTTILRDDIDELVGSQKSLMPDGVEKEINQTELTDLLEYLTQRGTFVPVDLREVATIVSDRGMFNGGDGRFVLDDWSVRTVNGVPFQLIDPNDGTTNNVVLLHGQLGSVSSKMPRTVSIPIGRSIRSLHLLSGVSGWGYPYSRDKSVSMIVRFHYTVGEHEDHELLNGVHFADYIRRVDVAESEFAFLARRQQMRYLAIHPRKSEPIDRIEFVKGSDRTAPVVMAATLEE